MVLSGAAAEAAGLPLGYMLGPAFVGLVLAAVNRPLPTDGPLGNLGRGLLGAAVGGMILPVHVGVLMANPELFPLIVLYVFASGWVGWFWLTRVGRWPRRAAWFAALPGGLSEMVELARQSGEAAHEVALAHTLRVFLLLSAAALSVTYLLGEPFQGFDLAPLNLIDWVLLLACVALGLALGRRINMPAFSVMGPLCVAGIAGLAFDVHARLDAWAVMVAQLCIGWSLAHRFTGSQFRQIRRGIWQVFGMLVCLVPVWLVAALAIQALSEIELSTAVLALAPGGQAEMALLALLLGASPALVVTLHIVRVVVILWGASRWRP